MNFKVELESRYVISRLVVVGDRELLVASRRTTFVLGLGPVAALEVHPEYVFVKESGSIFGMSIATGVMVEFEKLAPELRQSVLDSFSNDFRSASRDSQT